jgi:hypothetical protein
MASLVDDLLSALREKIEQQKSTIESLKREGHDCPDAERQLKQMLEKLTIYRTNSRQNLT